MLRQEGQFVNLEKKISLIILLKSEEEGINEKVHMTMLCVALTGP